LWYLPFGDDDNNIVFTPSHVILIKLNTQSTESSISNHKVGEKWKFVKFHLFCVQAKVGNIAII